MAVIYSQGRKAMSPAMSPAPFGCHIVIELFTLSDSKNPLQEIDC